MNTWPNYRLTATNFTPPRGSKSAPELGVSGGIRCTVGCTRWWVTLDLYSQLYRRRGHENYFIH